MSRPPATPSNPSPEPEDDGASGRENGRQSSSSPVVRPRPVTVLSALVGAEAAALLAAAAWYGFQLVTGAPVLSFWGAVFTLALLLAFASWLFAVAVFLYRGFRWPRAGALVAQLFVLTIGFPTLTGGYPVAGLAMLVPAAVGIVLLFDKRVIQFASRAAGSPPAL